MVAVSLYINAVKGNHDVIRFFWSEVAKIENYGRITFKHGNKYMSQSKAYE